MKQSTNSTTCLGDRYVIVTVIVMGLCFAAADLHAWATGGEPVLIAQPGDLPMHTLSAAALAAIIILAVFAGAAVSILWPRTSSRAAYWCGYVDGLLRKLAKTSSHKRDQQYEPIPNAEHYRQGGAR